MYNTERGMGAYASAKFTFNSSDLLYVIVGQKGTDACAPSDKVCFIGLSIGIWGEIGGKEALRNLTVFY